MVRKRDDRTLDIFSQRRPMARGDGFSTRTLRTQVLEDKISLAVSEMLDTAKKRKTKPLTREAVAEGISDMGVPTTKNALDDEAAQSKINHKISVARAVGLMKVTGDYRLLDLVAAELDLTIVPRRFMSVIDEAVLAEEIDEKTRMLQQLRKRRRQ